MLTPLPATGHTETAPDQTATLAGNHRAALKSNEPLDPRDRFDICKLCHFGILLGLGPSTVDRSDSGGDA